jgi:signal transduction histidine kinase
MITRGDLAGVTPEPWPLGLSPRVMRRMIDVTSVVVVAALLLNVGEPELMLDAVWITLAVSAFILGMRATVIRMVGILVLIEGSALANVGLAQPMESELADVTEWPLMIVVSTIVALMADRVSTTARRYAGLYRLASNRLTTAHEDERARLARDLHDGVGQTLTAVVLTLDAADASLRDTRDGHDASPDSVGIAVRRARDLSMAALDEAREVAAQLRPPRIDEIGLGAAIRDLAETAGVPVELTFPTSLLPPDLIEPKRQLDAFRVVQEAVGNAARHGRASRVFIDASLDGATIRLAVRDDGIGFDRSTTPVGLGLAGMQERATILAGELNVTSDPGNGTTVELVMPIFRGRAEERAPTSNVLARGI